MTKPFAEHELIVHTQLFRRGCRMNARNDINIMAQNGIQNKEMNDNG